MNKTNTKKQTIKKIMILAGSENKNDTDSAEFKAYMEMDINDIKEELIDIVETQISKLNKEKEIAEKILNDDKQFNSGKWEKELKTDIDIIDMKIDYINNVFNR